VDFSFTLSVYLSIRFFFGVHVRLLAAIFAVNGANDVSSLFEISTQANPT